MARLLFIFFAGYVSGLFLSNNAFAQYKPTISSLLINPDGSGIAMGSGSTLDTDTMWATSDYGKTWNKRSARPSISRSISMTTAGVNGPIIASGGIPNKRFKDLGMSLRDGLDFITISYDGGENWQIVRRDYAVMRDVQMIDKLCGYGYRDLNRDPDEFRIIKTTDGGKNWNIAGLKPGFGINGLAFSDIKRGLAISHEQIYRTTNGGLRWESCRFDLGNGRPTLHSVSAIGSNYIVIGDVEIGGMHDNLVVFLHSKDYGKTWETLISDRYPGLRTVKYVSESLAIAVGFGGVIAISCDGGATWKPIKSEVTTDISNVYFGNDLNGCILGRGFVMYSSDGGNSWHQSKFVD